MTETTPAPQTGADDHAPKTLAEKVWAAHLVKRGEDGAPDLVYIDLHLVHEVTSPQAFDGLRAEGRPVRRPDLTFSIQDHTVATKPGRNDDTYPSGAAFIRAMREGSARNGIRLFDLNLRGPNAKEQERIRALLVKLNDDSYDVREAAGKDILEVGFIAEAELQRAAKESRCTSFTPPPKVRMIRLR